MYVNELGLNSSGSGMSPSMRSIMIEPMMANCLNDGRDYILNVDKYALVSYKR